MAGNDTAREMMAKFHRIAFLLLSTGIVLIGGGTEAPLYSAISLLLFVWMMVAAVPLAGLLFGDMRENLLFVLPVGIIIHSLALSLLGLMFGVNREVFLVYLVLLVPMVRATWKRRKAVMNPPAAEKEVWLWLLLTFAVIAVPLLRVGADTNDGMAFRAYFSYDFLKHLSIAGSLSSTGIPPSNPYLSGYTLHYYWFFYVMPAYWMRLFPAFPPHAVMVMFTLIGATAFVASVYAALRGILTSRAAGRLCFVLLVAGGSYEGIYGIYRLQERGLAWTSFTTLNLDGLTRWYWKTPQIDTLYRSFLYAPQHLIVLCVFLIWLFLRKRKIPFSGRVLLYVLVFSTLGFGAILGALLIGSVTLFLLIDWVRNRKEKSVEALVFVTGGAFFLLLYFPVFQMFLPEGDSLRFGLVAPIRDRLPQYLLLNLGALLPFGLAGFVLRHEKVSAGVLAYFLGVSLFCMHYVKDHVGGSEVTLKLGYLVDLCMLILAAGFFERFAEGGRRRVWLFTVFGLALLPAFLTWGMDLYNAQDVTNRRFTTYVPQDEKRAFEWIRANLPADAVLQTDTLDAGQANVSTLPSLAQRSMYVGDQFHARAFQVPAGEVDRRRHVVTLLSRQKGSTGLSAVAQQAGIEYLVVGIRSSVVRELLSEPHFTLLFESGSAKIAAVNRISVDPTVEDAADRLWKDEVRVEYENFYDPETGPDSSLRRWMENGGRIVLHSQGEIHGTLRLDISSLGIPRHIRILSGERPVHEQEVHPGGTQVEFPLLLQAGQNVLVLHCPEGAEVADLYVQNGDQRLLSLQLRRLGFQP